MSNKKLSQFVKTTLESTVERSGSDAAKLNQNNIATILDALNVDKNIIHIDEALVETLGRSGVTVKNACSLLHKSFQYFDENPTMLEAFNRGRASLGSRVRSKLIEAALENNNIQSAIHLDKIFSGDAVATEVNLNVKSQLSAVSDEDLLKVAFTVDTVEDVPYGANIDNDAQSLTNISEDHSESAAKHSGDDTQ
jgi:hypothetical protein